MIGQVDLGEWDGVSPVVLGRCRFQVRFNSLSVLRFVLEKQKTQPMP